MKESVLVVCPGRGTYNATELGYLKRYCRGGDELVAQLDALRLERDQVTLSDLDIADKFQPSLHTTGDNASLLIYACALADFAAIDRHRYDIVAVTGNSMGWYLALACSGALELLAAGRLVNEMGALMHAEGAGGQIVYPLVDEEWRPNEEKINQVQRCLTEATHTDDINIHISIKLGGMLVLAADTAGLTYLEHYLTKTGRYPMRLKYHAAFHSPLLDHIIPLAKQRVSHLSFNATKVPMIDGRGKIWAPRTYTSEDLLSYTLGHQICQPFDFTNAIRVAVNEYAPNRIIVLGPGTTLGAPTAQTLIQENWRGLNSKTNFQQVQERDPYILSMGIEEQRALVVE